MAVIISKTQEKSKDIKVLPISWTMKQWGILSAECGIEHYINRRPQKNMKEGLAK